MKNALCHYVVQLTSVRLCHQSVNTESAEAFCSVLRFSVSQIKLLQIIIIVYLGNVS